MMLDIAFVYSMKNTVNGKIYVGSTTDPVYRFYTHETNLRRGVHSNKQLQQDYDLYGFSFEFSILETTTISKRFFCEKSWMEKLGTFNPQIGYNSLDGFNSVYKEENKLSCLLRKYEMSETELAKKAGISLSSVCRYVGGSRKPSFPTAKKILRAILDKEEISDSEIYDLLGFERVSLRETIGSYENWAYYSKNIYGNILALASEKGMTLTQIEESANITKGLIKHWKTRSPMLKTLEKVAAVLGVDSYDLRTSNFAETLPHDEEGSVYSVDGKYILYSRLRDSKYMTDNAVSKETGIPRSMFGDWKAGRSAPGYDKLCIIAKYFSVPADYFFIEKG